HRQAALTAAGLCADCRHARRVTSGRGSTFWRCGRAATDRRFARYPRLPVTRCDGFEATTAKLPAVDGPVAVAWSGGKDSALARHRALLSGYRPGLLVNMASADGSVRFHGVGGELVAQQADALGAELLQVPTAPEAYEARFEEMLGQLRARGAARPDVDVCGERGEYHTFVYDGPGFRAPVRFALGEPVRSEGYCIRPAHAG